jgi:hypothetical protein
MIDKTWEFNRENLMLWTYIYIYNIYMCVWMSINPLIYLTLISHE